MDEITNIKKKNDKRNNYLKEKINKTTNLKYNNIDGSSLDKRKKYSQTFKSRIKNGKKLKDNNNNSISMVKDKSNTTKKNKNKNYFNSFKNNNSKLLNSKRPKNLDSNDSFGVDYIIAKRKRRYELFNKKENHKNKFINTCINFEKTYNDINKDILSLIKINRISNNKKNYNSYKNLNDKESDYSKKISGKKNNLRLKANNINYNNKNPDYKFKKGKTVFLYNINNNSKLKSRNNEIIKIKNIKSIENYQDKKRKIINKNNKKANLSELNNTIINKNFLKILIAKNFLSNTQKEIKFTDKIGRRNKNNNFNSNNTILIKSYEGLNCNKLNNSSYNTNDIN